MGKYAKYEKKYKKQWEQLSVFQGWLKPGEDENHARCNVCRVELRAHKADLIKHKNTKIHKTKEKEVPKGQNTLTKVGVTCTVSTEQKNIDLKLAAYIAVHSSILSMDHLCNLLKSVGKGSALEELKIHRTKCTLLIKKVLAPAIRHEIIEDICQHKSYYSLIVDESTDVSVKKYLCICIKYFSESKHKLVIEFLGLIEVFTVTAHDLYTAVSSFLNKLNLDVSKLIGIGTDGANNLCGRNHSLYTLLKNDSPNLQLIKCICHSLHICAEKASAELPTSIEFLLRETYNWFSISPKRRNKYSKIFNLINIKEPRFQNKIQQLSSTRWLSRYKAIDIILSQWLELKTHFSMVNNIERCYTARTLMEMFKDESIYIYLIFLKPILKDINIVNLLFQQTDANLYEVFESLYTLILSTCKRILKPLFMYENETNVNVKIKKISAALENELAYNNVIDFGYTFWLEMNNSKTLSNDDKLRIETKCANFLKVLAKTLINKLPENFQIIQKIRIFYPSNCLNQLRPSVNQLPLEFKEDTAKIDDIDSQWRNLINIDWKDYFNGKIPNDPAKFWIFLRFFKNASGEFIFKELSMMAIKLLSLPLSNAVVERVFSVMNLAKTKIKNRMNLETLESLLLIRIYFSNNDICCCRNFLITKTMYDLFNYSIYDDTKENTEEVSDINEFENVLNHLNVD